VTRTLLLTTSFPPRLGGLETLLYQTNRRLAEPPLVLAPPPASVSDMQVRAVATGLVGRVAYRGLWRAHPSLHYLTTFWRAAARAMRDWRPEVVQVGHVALAPLGFLLARRARRPWLVYAYAQEVLPSPPDTAREAPSRARASGAFGRGTTRGRGSLDGRLRGGALRAAEAVVVPGRFTAGLVERWGVARERIVADIPFGAEPRPDVAPPEGTGLLSVGRLVPRKGIDTVLLALSRLPEPKPATYRVVGAGPDATRLRRLAHDLGLDDRVEFLGRVSEAALAEEYQRCAVFVLPSRRTPDGQLEGLGLVFFEAAAWGRPVVAGRSGGEVDAVVDGETGVLVDGESVDQVATALQGLLSDPGRLRRLGENGRRRVASTHNWRNAAARLDDLLRRLAWA
jgi:phosphatidylinositol alpha-1,6-mannosyltransferase